MFFARRRDCGDSRIRLFRRAAARRDPRARAGRNAMHCSSADGDFRCWNEQMIPS